MINKTEQQIMSSWLNLELPLVSVACITYNHEKYISEALDSILMQETSFPFEIVVGEDCSTDNSIEIIEVYRNKYPRIIRVLTSEVNVGGQKNALRIFLACRGKYTALCEGDDYWTSSFKLQHQVVKLRENPKYNICIHPVLGAMEGSPNAYEEGGHYNSDKLVACDDVIGNALGYFYAVSIMVKTRVLHNLPSWYVELPVGDLYIGILSSIPNGVLYLNTNMATYRKNVENSWTQRVMSSDIRFKWLKDINVSVNELDSYLDYKYSNALQDIIIKANYVAAMQSLSYLPEEKDDSVELLAELLRNTSLASKCNENIKSLRYNTLSRLAEFIKSLSSNQTFILYGFGTLGELIFPYINKQVRAIVDNSLYKRNQILVENTPIISSSMIKDYQADVLIVTPIYHRRSIYREVHTFKGDIVDVNILINFDADSLINSCRTPTL